MDRGRVISSQVWLYILRNFYQGFLNVIFPPAIRFVLSDAYTSMSREERQALLHEGVSVTTTLSAFGMWQKIPIPAIFTNIDEKQLKSFSITPTIGSPLATTKSYCAEPLVSRKMNTLWTKKVRAKRT